MKIPRATAKKGMGLGVDDDTFRKSMASDGEREDEAGDEVELKLGMWIFITTEILLFGTFFGLYSAYRFWHLDTFRAGVHHMDYWLGVINTVVLLTSSLAMAFAVREAQRGRRKLFVLCLLVTAFLGVVFLGIKGIEYFRHYEDALFPGLNYSPKADRGKDLYLFMSLYVVGTGLHALHLTIGIGLLACLAIWGSFWMPLHRRSAETVEVMGLYWHFIDVVWVFLFPAFYLIT